jgi:hypothetical protein
MVGGGLGAFLTKGGTFRGGSFAVWQKQKKIAWFCTHPRRTPPKVIHAKPYKSLYVYSGT